MFKKEKSPYLDNRLKQETLNENKVDFSWAKDLSEIIDSKQDLIKAWFEKYNADPVSFFNINNLELLKKIDIKDRLAMLAAASSSLSPSLNDFKNYYEKFPDDLEVVNRNCQLLNGRPDDNRTWMLWAASQPLLKDCQCEWVNNGDYSYPCGGFEQVSAIALRRNYAADALMPGVSDLEVADFSKYGKAAEGVTDLLKDARTPDFQKSSRLKPEKIVTEEFKKLSKKDKSALLRQALACFHDDKVWEEVYNSGFLPGLDKMLSRRKSTIHSTLFKTEHSNSFYNNEGVFVNSMNSTESRGGFLEEYGYERVILFLIESLSDAEAGDIEKNIDYLLTFWDKNRHPLFSGAIAQSLSKLNPEKAADKLLKMLRDEKTNKNFISAMLYRLEFGRLNISSEGANYLQKTYDLGEFNNPNFHVNRLTVDGDVGIFNDELELIKYFNLGQIDNEEKKIKAKVLDFTYETLFIGNKNETTEDRLIREKCLAEFKRNYYKIASDKIFSETGVQLNNLSFKEQGWFTIAFDGASEGEKEQMREFVKRNREEGIKSFLALDVDVELKEKILKIGLELPEEASRPLFLKLSEIIELVDLHTEELNDYFLSAKSKNIDWREVRGLMLRGAQDIILKFSSFDGEKVEIDKLITSLDKTKTNITLLSSLLRSIKESEHDLNWGLIKDLNLSIKDYGEDLSNQDKQLVLNIAEDNWKSFGNDKMAEVVSSGLKDSFKNGAQQKTYTLKYKDEVIGFVRFEKRGDDIEYAGSFNVSKDLRGLSIGKDLMENALMVEGNENVLEASASIKIPAACSYIEKVGFVGDGLIIDYHGTGENLFSIKLDKRENHNYELRNEGKKEKLNLEDLKRMSVSYDKLPFLIGQKLIVLSFDLRKEMNEYQEALQRLLPKVDNDLLPQEDRTGKYTLTRYFYDKESDPLGNVRYLAFERNH